VKKNLTNEKTAFILAKTYRKENAMKNRKRPSIARIEKRLKAKARRKAMTKKFRGMKILCM